MTLSNRFFCNSLIYRPFATACYQQKYTAQQHAPIRPTAMKHHPEAFIMQHFGFGGSNSREHDNNEWYSRQAGEQSYENEYTTYYLKAADKSTQEVRIGQAYFLKPARTTYSRKHELLYTLRQKHGTHHQPDEQGSSYIVSI